MVGARVKVGIRVGLMVGEKVGLSFIFLSV